MAPVGAKLSMQQLVDAMLYKTSRRAGKVHKYTTTELDIMEQKLQIAVSLLRGVRNSLQPINKLPPELLSLIFGELQQHLPSFLPMIQIEGGSGPVPVYTYDNHHKDWLNLLHVCRLWRGILATSPHLWSTVDSGLIPVTFLKRSLAAPLTAYLGIRTQEIPDKILYQVLEHSGRLRQLHLSTEGWESGTPVYQYLSSSSEAPLLTSLTILTDGEHVVNGALPVVFKGSTPRLTKLCLKYFTSWPFNEFIGLTHLCLYNQHELSRPTTSSFLEFLASSPQLEHLSLIQAGPTRPDGADTSAPHDKFVSLRCLKELNIGDWPSARIVSRLLSHLILPPTTDMYIWGDPLNDLDDDLSLLLPTDISRLENLHDIKKWYFARQPRVILDTPFIAVTGSPRTLYMYGTFSYAQIQLVISSYPLSRVRTLGVRDSCGSGNRMPHAIWTEIFERVPLLESLQILAFRSYSITRTVLGALMPYSPSSSPTVHDGTSNSTSSSSVSPDPSPNLISNMGSSSPLHSQSIAEPKSKQIPLFESSSPSNILCPHLHTLTIEHDFSLPAYFISTVASTRAALGSPISHLKVLVYDRNPYESRASSDAGVDREDSEVDEEYTSYIIDTEDHRQLLTKSMCRVGENGKMEGEVVFEYNIPLSMNIVPETWPTRAWEWTRRMHV
ncbi:hypothetical protein K435DRAFT_972231 [Dendrothele bispora CBS 962.96]|uniref:Uncharacterized protein n=1 Tax=Dendrothele bispora (strain CBS 962.96) TaxID=1314807 RepID=A0A4V4HC40_DENBC|nr:hypothetical protein K435DRAFT_972231 [Dendrothele bispora CBS 962.96]